MVLVLFTPHCVLRDRIRQRQSKVALTDTSPVGISNQRFRLAMSWCLNPDCQQPQNSERAEVCRTCGTRLLLNRRYRAIALLGQGGFGRTFLAVDVAQPARPRCVIKQFLPINQGTRHRKKAAELFEQEALRLEELGTHPQIPTLLEYVIQDQQQYLVQEFIDGKTLLEMLAHHGAFTEAQVRSLLTSLLPVLAFIHDRGVIHRDIKPANIIAVDRPAESQPTQDLPDWTALLHALSQETTQGFRDRSTPPYSFSEFLSHSLASPPSALAIADYRRCQEMSAQFASYSALRLSQRQYLVADASRVLYELRHKYDRAVPTVAARWVLVDFGAAKSVKASALSQTGTTIGSPEYTAPEQARGKATFASDLYSLGATCLHLLTNTSPADLFDPHENAWIWRRYLKAPISHDLGRLLDKLIEPGLKRRYASASQALQALPATPHSPPATSRSPWQLAHQLRNPGSLHAIALSPTAPLLVSSSGTVIKLWDAQTGQPIRSLSGHLDIIPALAIAPDGTLLVSGSADKTIRLWRLPTGERLASLTLHTDTVLALAIAPDGRTLASSSVYDPILLWDLHTGQERDRLYEHMSRVTALAFSPDGALLASGDSDGTVRLWDLGTSKQRTLTGPTEAIAALVFSPDGGTLAGGSRNGGVQLWSTRTRRLKRTLSVESGRLRCLAFGADGKSLIAGSDGLNIWSPRTGKRLSAPAGSGAVVAIAIGSLPDTTKPLLVSARSTGVIELWRS